MPSVVAVGSITIIDVMDGQSGGALMVTPSRALVFTSTDGVLDSDQQNITFTAKSNGVVVSTYLWEFSGFNTNPTNSGTYAQTITAAQFGNAKAATVTCTINGEYSESFTITRLEKSTAAAGATVGAPAGTSVGGVLAETVATKANGALQKAGDEIVGPVTFATNGGILAATDADNGVFMGPNGLVGKKAGENTFAISTDGTAYFDGAYMKVGSVGSLAIGEAAIGSSHIGELTVDSLRIQSGAVTYTNVVSSTIVDAGITNLDISNAPIDGTLLRVFFDRENTSSEFWGGIYVEASVNGTSWITLDYRQKVIGTRAVTYGSGIELLYEPNCGAISVPYMQLIYTGTPAAVNWGAHKNLAQYLLANYGVTGNNPLVFAYQTKKADTYSLECVADDYLTNSSVTVSGTTYPISYTGYDNPPTPVSFYAPAGTVITITLSYSNASGPSAAAGRLLDSGGDMVWNTRRPNYTTSRYKYLRLRGNPTFFSASQYGFVTNKCMFSGWFGAEIIRK